MSGVLPEGAIRGGLLRGCHDSAAAAAVKEKFRGGLSVPRRRNFPPTTAFQESRMGVVGAIVDRMEQYRRLAAQCVHMAAGTADLQFKAILIGMAGAWLKLADLAEKNSRAEGARNLIPSACDTPAAKSGQ